MLFSMHLSRRDVVRVTATHPQQKPRDATGFLLACKHDQNDHAILLTALHNVATVMIPDDPIDIEWFNNVRVTYRPRQSEFEYSRTLEQVSIIQLIAHDPWADWVAYEVKCPPSAVTRFHICSDTMELLSRDQPWFGYGFPDNKKHPFGAGLRGRIVTSGTPRRRTLGMSSVNVDHLELYAEQFAASSPRTVPGYSGSPVIVDGQAIAMILTQDTPSKIGDSTIGGTVYALPLDLPIAELRNQGYEVTPSQPAPRPVPTWKSEQERKGTLRLIESLFTEALESGHLGIGQEQDIHVKIEQLLGPRLTRTEYESMHLVTISTEIQDEVYLPLGCLRQTRTALPTVIRCDFGDGYIVPERPSPRPEGGCIVLACSSDHGELAEAAQDACAAGFADFKYLGKVSKADLAEAAQYATILLIACRINDSGFALVGSDGVAELLDPATLTRLLTPFVGQLRFVALLPWCEESRTLDPGRIIVDTAVALFQNGFASVTAPRVPLPLETLAEITSTLITALLGDARIPPQPLERALASVNQSLRHCDGLAHLGLRLYARAADGDDTRPFIIRPYRGLLAFEHRHARFYVGREQQIEQILHRLSKFAGESLPRLLILVGASGVGKSSLAQAGIIPRVCTSQRRHIIIRPTDNPLQTIKAVTANYQADEELLIIIDQLEESFTHASLSVATEFLQYLWLMSQDKRGTIVIATMRVDALNIGGTVIIDPDNARSLEVLVMQSPHSLFITHLDEVQIVRIIEEPARLVGLRLDEGLVGHLCTEATTQPGALPMLELVLDRLWEKRDNRTLPASAYKGGLAATLAEQANQCLSKLGQPEQIQARRILTRIAITDDAELATWRRRVQVKKVEPSDPKRRAAFHGALTALVEARLVVLGDPRTASVSESAWMELAHELLLRGWEDLAEWIRRARPQLKAMIHLERWVEEWTTNHTLLTERQIGYIDEAILDITEMGELDGEMTALLNSSREHHRKLRHRRKMAFMAAVVTSGLMLLLTYSAISRGRALELERNRATQQTELAERRLDHAVMLTRLLIWDTLPKLDPYPQIREVRKDLLDKLLIILGELAFDEEARIGSELISAHLQRGEEALESDDLETARFEYSVALDLAEKSTSVPVDHYSITVALSGLATIATRAGELTAARDLLERSLQIREQIAAEIPLFEDSLAGALFELAEVEYQLGDLTTASDLAQRSRNILEQLVEDGGGALDSRNLSSSLILLGDIESHNGALGEARRLLKSGLQLREQLAQRDPGSFLAQRDIRVGLMHIGRVELAAGDPLTARGYLERALVVAQNQADADPHSFEALFGLASALQALAGAEKLSGGPASAREHYTQALGVYEQLAERDPENWDVKYGMVTAHGGFARLLTAPEFETEFRIHMQAAHEILEDMEGGFPLDDPWNKTHAELWGWLFSIATGRNILPPLRVPPREP